MSEQDTPSQQSTPLPEYTPDLQAQAIQAQAQAVAAAQYQAQMMGFGPDGMPLMNNMPYYPGYSMPYTYQMPVPGYPGYQQLYVDASAHPAYQQQQMMIQQQQDQQQQIMMAQLQAQQLQLQTSPLEVVNKVVEKTKKTGKTEKTEKTQKTETTGTIETTETTETVLPLSKVRSNSIKVIKASITSNSRSSSAKDQKSTAQAFTQRLQSLKDALSVARPVKRTDHDGHENGIPLQLSTPLATPTISTFDHEIGQSAQQSKDEDDNSISEEKDAQEKPGSPLSLTKQSEEFSAGSEDNGNSVISTTHDDVEATEKNSVDDYKVLNDDNDKEMDEFDNNKIENSTYRSEDSITNSEPVLQEKLTTVEAGQPIPNPSISESAPINQNIQSTTDTAIFLNISPSQERYFLELCDEHHLKLIFDTKQYLEMIDLILHEFVEHFPNFKREEASIVVKTNPNTYTNVIMPDYELYNMTLKRYLLATLNEAVQTGAEISKTKKMAELGLTQHKVYSELDMLCYSLYSDDQKKREENNPVDNSLRFKPEVLSLKGDKLKDYLKEFPFENESSLKELLKHRTNLALDFKQSLKEGHSFEEAAVEMALKEFGLDKTFLKEYKKK